MMPKKIFFTRGVGTDKEKLTSFEKALRDGGIAPFNLVRVSSIFPPRCKTVSRNEGVKQLYQNPGSIVFCVMSENATNEPNRLLAASVACARPSDHNKYGYISEHHSFGQMKKTAGDYAEDLAATMLASTLGLSLDPDKAWIERQQEYKMSNQFVKTFNVTQTAYGHKKGLWTTVIAAAVFIME